MVLKMRYPDLGVRLEKVYNRAVWPPPGMNQEGLFRNIWFIKNPTLRAIRLKITYKDIFSNERRFRFQLTDSPLCEICGQVETVEHQLFSCTNAVRLWELYYRLSQNSTGSLYDVLSCSSSIEKEIMKSTIIKALLQIDRSRFRTSTEIVAECSYFLGIEARTNKRQARALQQCARRIIDIR